MIYFKNSSIEFVVLFTLDHANLGLTPTPDERDRYRTAGLEIFVNGLTWVFQLFTGDPGFNQLERSTVTLEGNKEVNIAGRPGTDTDKYRERIQYFGLGLMRFGSNVEWNRHNIQNKFAHDRKVIDYKTGRTVLYFKFLTNLPSKDYFYFGTGGGAGVY